MMPAGRLRHRKGWIFAAVHHCQGRKLNCEIEHADVWKQPFIRQWLSLRVPDA